MALKARRPSQAAEAKAEALAAVTDATPEKESKKRLNAEIPLSLHRRIKTHVAQTGTDISKVTRQLWEEYLKKASIE